MSGYWVKIKNKKKNYSFLSISFNHGVVWISLDTSLGDSTGDLIIATIYTFDNS